MKFDEAFGPRLRLCVSVSFLLVYNHMMQVS